MMSSLELNGGVKRLRRLIKKHVEAQVTLSWKGSMDRESMLEAEVAAEKAKKKLEAFLANLST